MNYIDGFVTPVPAGRRAEYQKVALDAAAVFKEYGALRVVECWGDDLPDGKLTDFKRAVNAKEGEAIAFSWIEWPSKQVREAGMAKAMVDPRMKMEDMVFDGKRLIYGGFQAIVDE